jgi:tetratricopeptide (TPR) repeat protein
MRRSLRHGRRSWAAGPPTIALFFLALTGAGAAAAPYRPDDDATVLERVPARSDLERLAPLRAAVKARPADLPAALALATGYIEIGRRNSDPRFVAYAQATLLPWLAHGAAPEPALVLQAITLQYLHQFDRSLALLERALTLAPLDGQAWLARAALLELRGDYAAARQACARLVRTADEITALTCLESVDGRNGRLAASYATLKGFSGMDSRLPAAVRAWKLAVTAEMAERLGDEANAEGDLRQALSAAPDDPYLKAAYADLLLRLDRPAEVLSLLRGSEAQDPLLLRLAIAGWRTQSPQAARWAQAYAERSSAAQREGDVTHLREQAMYLLEVQGDAAAALRAASSNWSVQREPADLRIYLRTARAAQSAPDRAAVAAWVAATHYEDRTLVSASNGARQP